MGDADRAPKTWGGFAEVNRPERQMMENSLFALSLGLVGLILTPAAGHAERQCAGHEMIAEALAKNFGEARRTMGLAEDNTVMELYASEATGTWTLTVTMPSGMTCLVAAGNSFEWLAKVEPTAGNPA